ncbi:hypothetical protein ACFVFI_07945 [Streptomyces sp. NPDC057705]|uniref:hypothetical protein n=1 Tax=Streptomyces sp. NPDC057705 TaxID=3346222 RepID=UPI0036893E5C
MNGMITVYAYFGLPVVMLVAFLLWRDKATRTKNLDGLRVEESARRRARLDKYSPVYSHTYIPPRSPDGRRR